MMRLQDGDVEDDPRYGTAMKAAPGCRTKQKLANVKKPFAPRSLRHPIPRERRVV